MCLHVMEDRKDAGFNYLAAVDVRGTPKCGDNAPLMG